MLIPLSATLVVLAMGISYVIQKERLQQLERRMAAEEAGRAMVRHVEQQLQQVLSTASLMAAAMHDAQSDDTTDLLADRVLKLHPAVARLSIENRHGNPRSYANGRLGAVLTAGQLPKFDQRKTQRPPDALLYPFGPPVLSIGDREITATQTIHQQDGKTSNRYWGTVITSVPSEKLLAADSARELASRGANFSISVWHPGLPTESTAVLIDGGMPKSTQPPVHTVDLPNGDRVVLHMRNREMGTHHAFYFIELSLVTFAAILFGSFLCFVIDFRSHPSEKTLQQKDFQ